MAYSSSFARGLHLIHQFTNLLIIRYPNALSTLIRALDALNAFPMRFHVPQYLLHVILSRSGSFSFSLSHFPPYSFHNPQCSLPHRYNFHMIYRLVSLVSLYLYRYSTPSSTIHHPTFLVL